MKGKRGERERAKVIGSEVEGEEAKGWVERPTKPFTGGGLVGQGGSGRPFELRERIVSKDEGKGERIEGEREGDTKEHLNTPRSY